MADQSISELFLNGNLKDIPGFENKYAASKDGQIWSYPKNQNGNKGLWKSQHHRIRRKTKSHTLAYASVSLGRKTYQVHRLIALTFIPNPNNYPMVNHLNGDGLYNFVQNLEWCDNKHNIEHAIANGFINYFTEKQMRIRRENGRKTIHENNKKRKIFLKEKI